jgi:hypothetical protein
MIQFPYITSIKEKYNISSTSLISGQGSALALTKESDLEIKTEVGKRWKMIAKNNIGKSK